MADRQSRENALRLISGWSKLWWHEGFKRITLVLGEIGKFILLFKLKSGLIFCWLFCFILEPALCQRLWLSDKCVNSELRYYYDSNLKRCQPFKFGNCLGNENIHPTGVDCHAKCAGLYHCLVFSRRTIPSTVGCFEAGLNAMVGKITKGKG